jgi:hypothetical protein
MITSCSLVNQYKDLKARVEMNASRLKMDAPELQASYAAELLTMQKSLGATNVLIEMTEAAEAVTNDVWEDLKVQVEAARKRKGKK